MFRGISPSARRHFALLAGLLGAALLGAGSSAQDAKSTKTDRSGDALPEGALARFGTLRWRHGDTVTFVAFVQDGKAILTGGQDGTMRLWERETGREIRRFDLPALPKVAQLGFRARPINAWGGGGGFVAALSRDGKTLALPTADNMIQLHDVDTGKEGRKLKGLPTGIAALAFSPDGKILAARGTDSTIQLLSAESGDEIRQIKPVQQKAGAVRVFIGGAVYGGAPPLVFSTDNKTLATVESEIDQANMKVTTYIKITDVDTGREARKIEPLPGSAPVAIAFSPDGKTLAFSTSSSTIHLRDADSGKELRQINVPNIANALMFTPDCKVLAAKGADQIIRLFNAETVKELHKLGEGEGALGPNAGFVLLGGSDAQGMSISPNGKTIATGSGNTIRTWDVETGKEKPLPAGGHRGPVSSLGVSADGKTLISRGADRVVRRWDLATGEELGNFVEPLSTYSFAVSPDGNTVAFGGTDATIRLHDAVTGKPIKDLKGHPAGTASVLFSPDGKLLASHGGNDNTIRVHDVAKGTPLQQIVLQTSGAANPGGGFGRAANLFTLKLAFSADSRTVLAQTIPSVTSFRVVNNQIEPAAGDPGSLKMWDVATGKEIRNIALSNQHGRGTIAISPDGRLIATETADQTISVWEIASGKQRSRLGQPEVAAKQANVAMAGFINVGGNIAMLGGRVVNGNTVAFSPDGTLLACKNTDHSIRVYNVVSGKEIGRFKGHQGPVSALAFTADGKRLATGSSDTTLLVWDVAGLKREPTPSPLELKAEEVADGWRELVGDDGEKALTAILKLSRGPKQTVPFLREQIKPAVPADPKKVAKLIADLDSEDFQERSGAIEELERLGDLAMPALQKALTGQPTLETRRRIEPLVAKLTGGVLNAEQIRVVRAIEALEKANSPEARQLLQSLAAGAPGALPTRETQKVLDRSPK